MLSYLVRFSSADDQRHFFISFQNVVDFSGTSGVIESVPIHPSTWYGVRVNHDKRLVKLQTTAMKILKNNNLPKSSSKSSTVHNNRPVSSSHSSGIAHFVKGIAVRILGTCRHKQHVYYVHFFVFSLFRCFVVVLSFISAFFVAVFFHNSFLEQFHSHIASILCSFVSSSSSSVFIPFLLFSSRYRKCVTTRPSSRRHRWHGPGSPRTPRHMVQNRISRWCYCHLPTFGLQVSKVTFVVGLRLRWLLRLL